jgi:hypothetical protein
VPGIKEMLGGGPCRNCELLMHQLEEAHKSLLALADARAYAIRYPRGAPPRDAPTDAQGNPIRNPPSSPGDLRRQRFTVPGVTDKTQLTPEEYELTFQAERDARNRGEAV